MIITLDGPAGAGKSTVARKVAEVLGISFLDTGATYRAYTWLAIQKGISLDNINQIAKLILNNNLKIEHEKTFINNKEVTSEIRDQAVTQNVKFLANSPKIRGLLVKWQQEFAINKSCISEGRDQGTVVFPDADYKFYLDADVNQRVKRRQKDLQNKGEIIETTTLQREITRRDKSDMNREIGPLKRPKDAVIIDSSELSIQQVVDLIINTVKATPSDT